MTLRKRLERIKEALDDLSDALDELITDLRYAGDSILVWEGEELRKELDAFLGKMLAFIIAVKHRWQIEGIIKVEEP